MQRNRLAGYQTVWVFSGGGQFPSGIFTTKARAEEWIARHKLTGTLTEYPVDVGFYDWAVAEGAFTPKREDQRTAAFIQRFASGYHHGHYRDGTSTSILESEGEAQ